MSSTVTLCSIQEIRLKLQAEKHPCGFASFPFKTGAFQRSVEICRTANIVTHLRTITAVCVVDIAGFRGESVANLAAFVQKLREPVVVV